MECPSCKTGSLRHRLLEQGLSGYSCPRCFGYLISLSPYVDWAVKHRSDVEPADQFAPVGQDSKKALLCPKCSRVMVKYKADADASHGLDFCFGCEEVWLDGGEWDYLKAKGLHTKITTITTDSWQRKLRDEIGANVRLEKFKQLIGEQDFAEVERFRDWLQKQPGREEILRYLNLTE